MKQVKQILLFSFSQVLFGCRESYTPALNLPATNFLVAEGFINNSGGATTITLTRTTNLTSKTNLVYETGANVRVEGKLNTIGFQLTETGRGVYTIPQLTLNAVDQYRIHIKTQAGKEYISDYSATRSTPDIDSVSWRRENGGLQIYANTHDPQAKTKYYQFKYDETWEFHSQYTTSIKPIFSSQGNIINIAYRDSVTLGYDSTLYKCWKSATLTDVLIATSEKLTQDVIYLQPLVYIPMNDWKTSVLYSINVKEYALSHEAYQFYAQLKKNTEQLGTTFDQQPTDNAGNLHCITDPAEPVVGFIEVTQEKQQRIFISSKQVPDWLYSSGCAPETPVPNTTNSLTMAGALGLTPTNAAEFTLTGAISKVGFAEIGCVDCRSRGINTKPSFWP